jgi:hypothetical protein
VEGFGLLAAAMVHATGNYDCWDWLSLSYGSANLLSDGMNKVIDMIRARGEDLHEILQVVKDARPDFEELDVETLQDLEGELEGRSAGSEDDGEMESGQDSASVAGLAIRSEADPATLSASRE